MKGIGGSGERARTAIKNQTGGLRRSLRGRAVVEHVEPAGISENPECCLRHVRVTEQVDKGGFESGIDR